MNKLLYGFFYLTLLLVFAGLLWGGVSVAVSLMLVGPVTVASFTALAFLYLLIAVIFEKSPQERPLRQSVRETWPANPTLPQYNG